jgi:hypothetical protein
LSEEWKGQCLRRPSSRLEARWWAGRPAVVEPRNPKSLRGRSFWDVFRRLGQTKAAQGSRASQAREPTEAVFSSRLAPCARSAVALAARPPPASPRAVSGNRTPGSGAGTLPLARIGGGFRHCVDTQFRASGQPNGFCAREWGREGNPTTQGQKAPLPVLGYFEMGTG